MITTKKHILIVTSEFPPLPGGIGNHIYNLATFLSKKQYNIRVIADQRADDIEEEHFDRSLSFIVHRVKLRRIRIFMYFKRIALLFAKIGSADVVLATGKFPLWIVAFISLFYNKEYIAVIHGSEVNFRNYLLRSSINNSLRRFSKIIAVSNYTKSLVSKLKLKPVKVIPNGFDASLWQANEGKSLKLKGNPVLLTVGNVTERKGQMNVIKHFPEVLKKYPTAHYHCVGFPTEKEAMLNVATELNIGKHITFHGRVKHGALRTYLAAADAFIMLSSPTSSGDVEGFGIAILEANFAGLPAIGSKGCGIEDAIDNNKSGILVDFKNSADFVKALETLLTNKEAFSSNARAWALKHSWSRVINLYIEEIERA